MEKAERDAMVPVTMGWSDIGSWDALHTIRDCDEGGSVCRGGDVVAIDRRGCLVRGDGTQAALVGVENLIVAAGGDDVLILPRGRSHGVKKLLRR